MPRASARWLQRRRNAARPRALQDRCPRRRLVRQHAFRQRHGHQANAAHADEQNRLVGRRRGDLLQRGIRGEARTHGERTESGREIANWNERVGKRHMHVLRHAAPLRDAKRAARQRDAELLIAGLAGVALIAAQPRIDGDTRARRRRTDACAKLSNFAFNLMTQHGRHIDRHRLLHFAEVEKAVVKVQIGMAEPGARHTHQRLARTGLLGVEIHRRERRAERGHGLSFHVRHYRPRALEFKAHWM